MTRARSITATAAVAVLTFGASAAFAQQNQNNQPQDQQNDIAGQAQIREKEGPTFDVRANQPCRMIVLFPEQDQNQSRGAGSMAGGNLQDLELVLVEMQVPQQAEGEQGDQAQLAGQRRGARSGQGIPTGREIVFSPGQAAEGLAQHRLESNGQHRQYMVIARSGNQQFEINETAGGDEGILLLRVQAQPTEEQMQQYEEQMTQYRERQQQRSQQNQQNQQNQNQQDQQQNQQQGQQNDQNRQRNQQRNQQQSQQQGQQSDEPQPPQPTDAALIMVYTGPQQQQR